MKREEKLNILNLDANQAKKFFLEAKNYCNLELPKYINFQELLEKLSLEMRNNNYKSIKQTDPENYSDINYILFNNKDGGYDWRPYQIINPVMYISLVNEITKEENWNIILERFRVIDSISYIECGSIPVVENLEGELLNKKSSQILNWWDKIEQNSIKLSLEYDYLFQTDIVNCYAEIYTHSIAWAIHTKKTAKENKRNNTFLGNIIDGHLQNMSYGQTNGIPQGSILMDFIAEILFKYADELITNHIKEKEISKDSFHILRYRDDYRIFVKDISVGREILKIIAKELLELGLKLNVNKTNYSNNIVLSSIKKDKIEFLKKRKEYNIQKRLILLYEFSLSYPNSGSILKEITQIREVIERRSNFFKDNIEVLISIITEIIYKNPKIYVEGNAILSYLFPHIKDEVKRREIIKKVFKKLKRILNSGYFEIWFQRATLKESRLDIEYNENICKLVNSEIIKLWNIEWISSNRIKKIFEKTKIINQDTKNNMPQKIDGEEIKIFNRYGAN